MLNYKVKTLGTLYQPYCNISKCSELIFCSATKQNKYVFTAVHGSTIVRREMPDIEANAPESFVERAILITVMRTQASKYSRLFLVTCYGVCVCLFSIQSEYYNCILFHLKHHKCIAMQIYIMIIFS